MAINKHHGAKGAGRLGRVLLLLALGVGLLAGPPAAGQAAESIMVEFPQEISMRLSRDWQVRNGQDSAGQPLYYKLSEAEDGLKIFDKSIVHDNQIITLRLDTPDGAMNITILYYFAKFSWSPVTLEVFPEAIDFGGWTQREMRHYASYEPNFHWYGEYELYTLERRYAQTGAVIKYWSNISTLETNGLLIMHYQIKVHQSGQPGFTEIKCFIYPVGVNMFDISFSYPTEKSAHFAPLIEEIIDSLHAVDLSRRRPVYKQKLQIH